MKQNKLIGSKIALGLGLLLLFSYRMGNMAGNNSPFSNLVASSGIISGSLAYMARRRQNEKPSSGWRIIEIVSIIVISYFVFLGIISGAWYLYPISYMIIPICSGIAYAIAFKARTKKDVIVKKGKNELQQNSLSDLEKIAELKAKGIITEEEFIKKKKQILNI